MNQMAFSPVAVLRHRMSALPSPLKSPTPRIVQWASLTGVMSALLARLEPVISQMAFCPVAASRHRRSALPSPLKSPMPATVQSVSATGLVSEVPVTVVPLMNQMAFCPVLVLRHRMSAVPSPLKSCFTTAAASPNTGKLNTAQKVSRAHRNDQGGGFIGVPFLLPDDGE